MRESRLNTPLTLELEHTQGDLSYCSSSGRSDSAADHFVNSGVPCVMYLRAHHNVIRRNHDLQSSSEQAADKMTGGRARYISPETSLTCTFYLHTGSTIGGAQGRLG